MIEYKGERYFDDRLFVMNLCQGRIQNLEDGTVETTIFHEEAPIEAVWCLATYRNCAKYPLVSLNHFETKEDASKYLSLTEPTVPLISLNGSSSNPPRSYADHLVWKRQNNLSDYDYRKAYTLGGENHREIVMQLKEHYLDGMRRVTAALR
jgi:hypothetical protein